MEAEKAWMRVPEAAELAGCSRTTAYELIRAGEWPSVQAPYGKRVVRAGLLEWMEKVEREE